ncbi:adhesion G protein-coupled receptor F5-like [Carettochelys insculpta]|uniref:adhesion G protein-coupled receptor F5-like n=1 Tax=Carettochelys insculpta TaxID=44489 RepID=UPI003EB92A0A
MVPPATENGTAKNVPGELHRQKRNDISTISIKMSVRLNGIFQDDLRNPSSELYRKYKKDLEDAFTAQYRFLPGFISATVTGFRNGNVTVDYEVKAAPKLFSHIEDVNRKVVNSIDASYKLDPNSFCYSIEIPGEISLLETSKDIFSGDTVIMKCETNLGLRKVSWYRSGHLILSSSRHSIHTTHINEVTETYLKVKYVTQDDTGSYTCILTSHTLRYTVSVIATNNITVMPINIVPSKNTEVVCNGTTVSLSCCINGDIQLFTRNWKPNGAINISGTTSFTTNCTVYTLQANQYHCPSDTSDTKTTYTCELRRRNGTITSKSIQVTFLRIEVKQMCYSHNYTESCNSVTNVTVFCTVMSRIQDKVESSCMRLTAITENKDMCSDSLGVGEQGRQIIKPYPTSKDVSNPIRGNLTYVCINKTWNLASNSCLSEQLNTLLSDAESLVSGPQTTTQIPTYLENLRNGAVQVQQEINNSPQNLGALITILDLVSERVTGTEPRAMENFLSTVDVIVSSSTIDSWKKLNNQEIQKSARLLNSVEKFSQSFQPVNNTIPPINNTNLQLQGTVITENNTSDYNPTFVFPSSANLNGSVLISGKESQRLGANTTIISVAFSTLKYILPQSNETNVVNGLVMTTTVNRNLPQDFQIKLIFAKSNASLGNPKCVFWNFSLSKDAGGWDDTGCQSMDNGSSVICTCNHLSSFSILMSPNMDSNSTGYSNATEQALSYITYIGLYISVTSLVVCILIESLVWKYVTKNRTSYMRHVCILNIAVSLLIADIWFIVAASTLNGKKTVNEGVCIAATFFIHLFYLCVFFWMLAMGLMIFYHLVFILHDTSKTIQKTVVFSLGYGCPLIISVITIAVTQPHYTTKREHVCWLNWKESKALLAFVLPALIIVAVNLITGVVVIVKILRPVIGDKPSKQERSSLIQAIKSVGILTPLLGFTWGFGLATMIEKSPVVFHVLFNLLNAFQGLFILLFGTLRDKKVQETLLNKLSSGKWSVQQTQSPGLKQGVTPVLEGDTPDAQPEEEPVLGPEAFAEESAKIPGRTNHDASGTSNFCQDQREDPTLSQTYGQVATMDGTVTDTHLVAQCLHFQLHQERLYRVDQDPRTREQQTQLLVPECYHRAIMRLAHDIPTASHMGQEKTLAQILFHSFWPGVHQEVKNYCNSCPTCQLADPPRVPKAPFISMPVVGIPFERGAIDLVGLLPKSLEGYQFVLVLVNYATCFPEAIPLCSSTACTIVGELMKVFARVGLPQELFTDQRTNFTSHLMRHVCVLTGIKQLHTSVYHPQTDGLVACFNRTLKDMMCKFPPQDLRCWDQLLPPLLLAIREVPQSRHVLLPLRATELLEYVFQLQERLEQVGALAKENLKAAQEAQPQTYNWKAQNHSFEMHDRVLVLLPSSESKLLAQWQGPYEVVRAVGPVTYEIHQPDRWKKTQRYHVNLLKPWRDRENFLINPCPPEPELGPQVPRDEDPAEPSIGSTLTEEQRKQAQCLLQAFRDNFTTLPGHISLVSHVILTEPGKVIREATCPLPF